MSIFITIISFVLVIIGIVGIIIPVLPGTPLVFLGCLIYTWFYHFEPISLTIILIFLGLTILSVIFDYLGKIWGAQVYGSSKWGIVGALLGLLLGFLIFNPLAIIILPFLGVVVFEVFIAKKEFKKALRAGWGTFVFFLLG